MPEKWPKYYGVFFHSSEGDFVFIKKVVFSHGLHIQSIDRESLWHHRHIDKCPFLRLSDPARYKAGISNNKKSVKIPKAITKIVFLQLLNFLYS